jgi:transcriptional regulator with XRE-family HTH domain
MQRFGDKLRALRLHSGWTLQQLATALGYAAISYMHEIESGKKKPTVELVIKAAHLFHVTTDQLILDEVDLPNPLPARMTNAEP